MKNTNEMSAPTEIELKLALAPAQLDALLRHPVLANAPQEKQILTNTYFDTPKGHLAAAKVAVRLRRIDGRVLQTVKTAGHGGGGLSSRQEWEWQVPEHTLDAIALASLPPFQSGLADAIALLRPTLSTDFTRCSWQLQWEGSHIELVFDDGEIVCGEARAPICEVELELKAGDSQALWSLAGALAGSVPLRPSDSSKAARGNALGNQQWPLPDAEHPAEWLHRATVALDAYHDSHLTEHLTAAQQALATLAKHPELDDASQAAAALLPKALDNAGMPTTAYGVAALTLAHRLAHETALR
ncbi:CYTH domain-containing protein [Vreelandella sp.]|uniref:CYTH domain-containing protein n=1 Tax=Vreelandella sp. TaxID=3137778 RepID=UPI003BAAE5F0